MGYLPLGISGGNCRLLCWLIEVIFLLDFYYIFIFIIYIYIREISWRHGASMSIHSVINKGINIEGCKIPIGSEPINKRNTRL